MSIIYRLRPFADCARLPRPKGRGGYTIFYSPAYLWKVIDLNFLRESGVKLFGTEIFVEEGCAVESGAELYAPAYILGKSHICRNARVLPCSYISSSYVGENTLVFSSTLINAQVRSDCSVGPYAYLRDSAYVDEGCRVGDFVEIKSSSIGKGSKAAHLAYIGDAEIGRNVNIGCGAVFANYDGKTKNKSKVGDGCFIGSNCNLIAPVNLGAGAFIAAGTKVTRDVEEYALCIGRQRETVLPQGGRGRYSHG